MNATKVVYLKEMRELLRDKRVRSSAIIMPMVLIIGMLALFGFISGVGEKENQHIHVVGPENSFVRSLRKEKVRITVVDSEEAGEKLIREGKAQLLLQFEPDFDRKIAGGLATSIQASYDPQVTPAKIALGTVQEELAKLNGKMAVEVLRDHGLTPETLNVAQVRENKIKVGKEEANDFLVSLLPYFIVIWAFYGGMGTAADLVAGEKEKYTLETLLIAPVGRSQIAFGKFFALCTICLMSSLSALAGFVVAGLSGASIYAKLFPHGLGLGLPEIGVIVIVLLPTVAFFASLLIAISTYAKNSREAQSYLALLSFVVIMPAVFGQVIGLTDLASNWWIRLVPVLNTSVTVREAIQGKTNALGVVLTVLMGAVLAVIAIRIAIQLFKREEVLIRI